MSAMGDLVLPRWNDGLQLTGTFLSLAFLNVSWPHLDAGITPLVYCHLKWAAYRIEIPVCNIRPAIGQCIEAPIIVYVLT